MFDVAKLRALVSARSEPPKDQKTLFSRRTVFRGGALGLFAAAAAIPMSLGDFESLGDLDVEVGDGRIVFRLGDRAWIIDRRDFGPASNLAVNRRRRGYKVALSNALLPGTGCRVDMTAILDKRSGSWRLRASFDRLPLTCEVEFAAWLTDSATISCTLPASQAGEILRSLGSNLRAKGRSFLIRLAPDWTFSLETDDGGVAAEFRGGTLEARSVTFRNAGKDGHTLLNTLSVPPRITGTVVEILEPRVVGDFVLGRAPSGAAYTVKGDALRLARLEISGDGGQALFGIAGAGRLIVDGVPHGLRFDDYVLLNDGSSAEASTALVGRIAVRPHRVDASEASVTVSGGEDGDFLEASTRHGVIHTFKARARLRCAHVPLAGADYSRLDFEGQRIAFDAMGGSGVLIGSAVPDSAAPALTLVATGSGPVPESASSTEPEAKDPDTMVLGLGKDGFFTGPLDGASLKVRRAHDLMSLDFGFHDLALVVRDGHARIVPARGAGGYCDPAIQQPRLIVNFPPQHVVEKCFFRQLNDQNQNLRYRVDLDPTKFQYDPNSVHVEEARDLADNDYKILRKHFRQDMHRAYKSDDRLSHQDQVEVGQIMQQFEMEPFVPLVEAHLSGPSRLVFEIPCQSDEKSSGIDFTLAALTDWSQLDLAVAQRAFEPPGDPNNPENPLVRRLRLLGITANHDWRQRMKAVMDTMRPPGPTETAIELPFRLLLSPSQNARWLVPRSRVGTKDGTSVLWHARLDAVGGKTVRAIWSPDFSPGTFVPTGSPPEHNNVPPWPVPDNKQFRMPMDMADRHEIVGLSSMHGLPALPRLPEVQTEDPNQPGQAPSSVVPNPTGDWVLTGISESDQGIFIPQPLRQADIFLTSLGGYLQSEGLWEPPAAPYFDSGQLWPAFNVQRWQHNAVLGRDITVEVVYKGFHFPLGTRITIVKRTERRFYQNAGDVYPTAYLIQHLFIRPGKPDKTYPGLMQPYAGRDWYAPKLTLSRRPSPDILDYTIEDATPPPSHVHQSGKIDLAAFANGATVKGTAFWPRTAKGQGYEVLFEFTIGDDPTPVVAPLIVIDNTAAHDPAAIAALLDYYNQLPNTQQILCTAHHHGARRSYAPSNKQGETDFETDTWVLAARGRGDDTVNPSSPPSGPPSPPTVPPSKPFNPTSPLIMDATMEGADQPPYYPVVYQATVRVQSLDRLLGRQLGNVTVAYDRNYVKNGFDAGKNPAEIYLDIVEPTISLDLSADGSKVGGIAKPNAQIVALSRSKGPIGGARPLPLPPPASARARARDEPPPADPRDPGFPAPPGSEAAQAGQFDPAEFFGGALSEAKLLGLISLKDVVQLAKFAGAAPQLTEAAEYAFSGVGDLLSNVIDNVIKPIQGAIKNLRDQADSALKKALGDGVTFAVLYPKLDASLQALADALSQLVPQGPQGPQSPDLSKLGTVVERGKAVLSEIERIKENPAPAVILTAIKTLQDGWEKIRRLGDGIENAAKDFFKNVAIFLLRGFCNSAQDPNQDFANFRLYVFGNASDDLSSLCSNFDPTSPKDWDALLGTLAKRMAETLFYEIAGQPLMQAYTALGEFVVAAQAAASDLPELGVQAIAATIEALVDFARFGVVGKILNQPAELCAIGVEFASRAADKIIAPARGISSSVATLDAQLDNLNKAIPSQVGPARLKLEQFRVPFAQGLQKFCETLVALIKARDDLNTALTICSNLKDWTQATARIFALRREAIARGRDLIKRIFDTPELFLSNQGSRPTAEPLLPDLQGALRVIAATMIRLLGDLTSIPKIVQPQGDTTWAEIYHYAGHVQGMLASIPIYANEIADKVTDVEKQANDLLPQILTTANDITNPQITDPQDLAKAVKKAIDLAQQIVVFSTDMERDLAGLMMSAVAVASGIQQQLLDWTVPALLAPINLAWRVYIAAQNALQDIYNLLFYPIPGHEEEAKYLRLLLRKEVIDAIKPDKLQPDIDKLMTIQVELNAASSQPSALADALDRARKLAQEWRKNRPALVQQASLIAGIVESVAHGNLSALIDFGQLEKAIGDAIAALIPAKITLHYDWGTQLKSFPADDPVFEMQDTTGEGSDLTLSTKVVIGLTDQSRYVETLGTLKPFKVILLGSSPKLITINFDQATFSARTGESPSFDVKVQSVTLSDTLEFIKDLAASLSPKTGPYVLPSLDPPGIEAGFRLNPGTIHLGPMTLSNLALSVACELPFDNRSAHFRFAVADRTLPFLISFIDPPYGGGGFVSIVSSASQIVGLEAAFEFGAVVDLSFPPLQAQGRITAGIYIKKTEDHALIRGFVHAVGEGQLACFSIAVLIEVGLEQSGSSMVGYSIYEFTFKIGFVSLSLSFEAHYAVSGSASGGAAQSMAVQTKMHVLGPASASEPKHLQNNAVCKSQNWPKYWTNFDLTVLKEG